MAESNGGVLQLTISRTAASSTRRSTGRSEDPLNSVIRGWGNYFRYGNSGQKFDHIDAYVNERLAPLASTKHGRTGRNWTTDYTYEWVTQLGVCRLGGKVTRWPAHASR